MRSKRRVVNGIVTNGCSDKEYRAIYRKKTPEAQMKKALDMGKLDLDFAQKLIKTLKGNPKTRRMIGFFWIMGLMGGIAGFTVEVAVTGILYHTFL